MNGPGGGPSQDYMSQLLAGLGPAPGAAPIVSGTPLPPVAPPAPEYPALASVQGPPPPPAPPAGMSLPTDNPAAMASVPPPMSSQGPPPGPHVGVEPPAAPPEASTLDPTQVEFRPVGGGGVPAHEAYTRGPHQDAHLMASFAPPAEAAKENGLRNYMQSEHEDAMYERQANAALQRQDAAERVLARRQQETQSMMQDYQDSIQKLGEMHLDQNRYFANQSTGEKIANVALMFAGGFFGGPNGAAQRIYKMADQDIEAQKFDYQTALDHAKGQQTAFGMMMDRYGSEDAATAAARAAALDYAASKVQQEAAQWKGTGAQNQTAQLLGDIASTREQTIAAGFKFVPATNGAPRYQMAFRGHVAPGTFSEKEAQTNFLAHQTAPAQEADKAILGGEVATGVSVATEHAKALAEKEKAKQTHNVVLPNGQTVNAPTDVEAKDLRDLAVSQKEIQRLVSEAKKIRDGDAWRVDPSARARLGQIQKNMITQYGVQNKLGALSSSDLDLAVGGTADLFEIGPGVTQRLDRMVESAQALTAARVSTYEGAPAAAAGKMPGSFKPAGGK